MNKFFRSVVACGVAVTALTTNAATFAENRVEPLDETSNSFTIYMKAPYGTNLYSWGTDNNGQQMEPCGAWPGTLLSETVNIGGDDFYYFTFVNMPAVNLIFNKDGNKAPDIYNIVADTYFEYDGLTTVTQIEAPTGTISPIIRANPADGTVFSSSLSVALTVTPATDIYYTLDGSRASATSTKYTGPITLTETTTINAYAAYEDADTCISFTYTKEIPVGSDHAVYFYNDDNWKNCYAYCYDDNHKIANAFSGAWPGKKFTQTVEYDGMTLYKFGFTSDGVLSNPMIIFNNNNGIQTSDKVYQENAIYNCGGLVIGTYTETPTGINKISASGNFKVFAQDGRLVIVSERNCTVEAVKLDGTCRTLRVMNGYNYFELPKGFYIVAGKKVVI